VTIVGDGKPLILRHQENGRDGFVVLPTSDNWERKLFFADWDDLCGWVEALAGQVVPVIDPAAELEPYDTWLAARS
jgi:hypothetical protein